MSYCNEHSILVDQLPTNINCGSIGWYADGTVNPTNYADIITEAISEECDSAVWTTVKSLYDWYFGCGYFLLSYAVVPTSNTSTSDVCQSIIDTLNRLNISWEWNNKLDCRIKVFSTPCTTCLFHEDFDLTLYNFETTSIYDHETEEQQNWSI